jgi:hypothetical protein
MHQTIEELLDLQKKRDERKQRVGRTNVRAEVSMDEDSGTESSKRRKRRKRSPPHQMTPDSRKVFQPRAFSLQFMQKFVLYYLNITIYVTHHVLPKHTHTAGHKKKEVKSAAEVPAPVPVLPVYTAARSHVHLQTQNASGATPVHIAAQKEHAAVTEQLLAPPSIACNVEGGAEGASHANERTNAVVAEKSREYWRDVELGGFQDTRRSRGIDIDGGCDKGRAREGERKREKDKERGMQREREREMDGGRTRDRERERERERDKDRERDIDRERDREGDRNREGDGNRYRERERDRERERQREMQQDGGRDGENREQSSTRMQAPGGLPVSPGEQDCAYFRNTGHCKYGDTRKRNHAADRETPSGGGGRMQDGGGCMRSLLGSREFGRERERREEKREAREGERKEEKREEREGERREEKREEREGERREEKREVNSPEYEPGGIFIRFDGTPEDSDFQVRSTCSKVVWTKACHPTN